MTTKTEGLALSYTSIRVYFSLNSTYLFEHWIQTDAAHNAPSLLEVVNTSALLPSLLPAISLCYFFFIRPTRISRQTALTSLVAAIAHLVPVCSCRFPQILLLVLSYVFIYPSSDLL